MAYNYPPTDPHALIQRITEDAYCILEMQEEREQIRQLAQEVAEFHGLDMRIQNLYP